VNETPKFKSLNPTKLSHSISVRGDNVEDVLVIPLEIHGVVSCFPNFKSTELEFETFDRYELTYESPEYDPSATTFHDQEAGMMDYSGNLKVSGDFHPKRHQACSLLQKEEEVKLFSSNTVIPPPNFKTFLKCLIMENYWQSWTISQQI
jgi:hypothetical protein